MVTVPWDPALETGGQTGLSALRRETQDGLVEMAAAVADFTPERTSEGKLARAGVSLGTGSDIWQIPTGVHLELEEMVAADASPVDRLPLLPEDERRRMLVEWNATATEYPQDSTLPQVFSEVVARHGIVATSDPLAAEAGADVTVPEPVPERATLSP